ncbi:MAG: hypothetical protein IKR25_04200 [Muribaculaceae bacterium]|nr:hypothetical protein [Muribaculaceae bacterium]
MALLSAANEYVFDLREATIPTTGNTLEMTSSDGEVTLTITIPEHERLNASQTYSMSDCVYDSQTGRLKIIWGSGASVHVKQNMGRNLNFVELGEWTYAATGENLCFNEAHFSPDRSNPIEIKDYIPNGDEAHQATLNLFNLKNRGDKTEMQSSFNWWEECFEVWIGPTFVVRDERITLEDLTFADHAVKNFYHTITDDLVGVKVESVTGGVGQMLFCRSAQPISSAHKHGPNPDQQLWERDGVIPEYADPNTVQYAWIALKIDNAEDYVGKRFNNVRGLYCPISGRERGNYFGWLDPNMQVTSTPEILESGVETKRNTYCVANFSEQDDHHFFFLEPRPCEICNVIEAMRTGNDVILAPTSDAITPDGDEIYVDNLIEGGTAFFNGFGIGTYPYEQHYAYIDVDQQFCEETWDTPKQFAWKTYFKLFDFTEVIVICFSNNQIDDALHEYPLDTPNPEYDQDEFAILLGLMGTGDTHASLSGDYDEEFFMGFSNYYSRYDWRRNVNVYKNDMHINLIEHPHENLDDHLAALGNMVLMRCDYAGTPLDTVATLTCLAPGQYLLTYNQASQTAIHNGVVDEMLIENGEVLGHPVTNNQVYNLVEASADHPAAISFSDCFLSEPLLTKSSIQTMKTDYTYRLLHEYTTNSPETGNDDDEYHIILSHIPVYNTLHNEVWRASLTKEDVDADTTGVLTLGNDLHMKFSSSTNNHVLTYHLLEGHGSNDGVVIDSIAATHPHYDFEHNTYENTVPGDGYEHYNQHEDEEIGWDNLWFVPVIESDHNNNTYGSYKQTINRAYVYLERDMTGPNSMLGISALEEVDENNVHYRYFHTSLHLWSEQELHENANSENRYLYRVWREVKSYEDGSSHAPRRAGTDESTSNLVLLNTYPEFGGEKITMDDFVYWATDYAGLQTFTGGDINVSDTFLHEVPASHDDLDQVILSVDYHAVLYVHDTVEDYYYPVSSVIVPVTWDLTSPSNVITGVETIDADNRAVKSMEFYDVAGQRMTSPKGLTIVVTRFTDGSVVTTKQIFK